MVCLLGSYLISWIGRKRHGELEVYKIKRILGVKIEGLSSWKKYFWKLNAVRKEFEYSSSKLVFMWEC